MVIALDIDDTISRHPAFFAAMSGAMRVAGHRIVIITLREDRASASGDLAKWCVEYDELVCATTRELMEHGDAWKARVCDRLGVDVLFDDAPGLLHHVRSRTACMLVVDHARYDLCALRDRDDPGAMHDD